MGNNTFLSDHDFQEEENMSNYIGEEIELEDGRIHSYKSHLGNGYRVSHNKHSVPHANRGYYTDVDCARRQREEAFKEEVKMSLYDMAWQHLAKPLCRTCLIKLKESIVSFLFDEQPSTEAPFEEETPFNDESNEFHSDVS